HTAAARACALLPHGGERPAEARGRDAFILDGRGQDDAGLPPLPEPAPEGLHRLLLRAGAGGAEATADGPVVVDGAVADDDVTPLLAQLQPQQPVAAQDGQRVEASAEGGPQVVDVLAEWRRQHEPA